MAKAVDHERRRRKIAETALRLFSQIGFDNVSFQMLAAAVGISRPTLYQYFKSKREIFDAAVRAATEEMRARCRPAVAHRGKVVDKIEAVCSAVTDVMSEDRQFLSAVFGYLHANVRTGREMNGPIVDFTSGVRDTLSRLLEYGKKRGEFPSDLDVENVTDVLYATLESYALRIVMGLERDGSAVRRRLQGIYRTISVRKGAFRCN